MGNFYVCVPYLSAADVYAFLLSSDINEPRY